MLFHKCSHIFWMSLAHYSVNTDGVDDIWVVAFALFDRNTTLISFDFSSILMLVTVPHLHHRIWQMNIYDICFLFICLLDFVSNHRSGTYGWLVGWMFLKESRLSLLVSFGFSHLIFLSTCLFLFTLLLFHPSSNNNNNNHEK